MVGVGFAAGLAEGVMELSNKLERSKERAQQTALQMKFHEEQLNMQLAQINKQALDSALENKGQFAYLGPMPESGKMGWNPMKPDEIERLKKEKQKQDLDMLRQKAEEMKLASSLSSIDREAIAQQFEAAAQMQTVEEQLPEGMQGPTRLEGKYPQGLFYEGIKSGNISSEKALSTLYPYGGTFQEKSSLQEGKQEGAMELTKANIASKEKIAKQNEDNEYAIEKLKLSQALDFKTKDINLKKEDLEIRREAIKASLFKSIRSGNKADTMSVLIASTLGKDNPGLMEKLNKEEDPEKAMAIVDKIFDRISKDKSAPKTEDEEVDDIMKQIK